MRQELDGHEAVSVQPGQLGQTVQHLVGEVVGGTDGGGGEVGLWLKRQTVSFGVVTVPFLGLGQVRDLRLSRLRITVFCCLKAFHSIPLPKELLPSPQNTTA